MKSILSTRFGRRVSALCVLLAALAPALALADLGEEQKLTPTAIPSALAGAQVAISGTTAVVGAPGDTGDGVNCVAGAGAAYVYNFDSGTSTWSKDATLCAVVTAGVAGDQFGAAVSIDGGNIAVGAPGIGGGAGGVYVFSGGGASWTENPTVLAAATTGLGNLGSSVSIKGLTVAAGAPNAAIGTRLQAGVAAIFRSSDGGATFSRTLLRASGGQARAGGLFGTSISLSGNSVAVGTPGYHTGPKLNSGTAFVFVINNGVWSQQTSLRPANIADNRAGASVALDGDTLAVGTPGDNSGQGAVYIYTRTGTTWGPPNKAAASDGASGDHLGASTALSGALLVAGAPDASNGGKAYEFPSSGGSEINALVASGNDTVAGDLFGASSAVDSGRAVVGAPSNATFGAAYVFELQSSSVTTINSTDPNPSLTGQLYTVSVTVTDGTGGAGIPTGSVNVTDGNGAQCSIATLDGTGSGSCQMASNFFGTLTVHADYSGDTTFAKSSGTASHDVTGAHFVFNPTPPANIPQGNQVDNLVVEVHDPAENVITSDNDTTVTLSVDDTCGATDVIGTLTVNAGVATFTAIGPRFYTLTTGNGDLGIHAVSNDVTVTADSNFDVVAPPAEFIKADGFEDCRL